MNLKNCPGCGKMYVQSSLGACEECRVKEEEGFMAIKSYIDENNSCTLGELAEATGVHIKKILGYIREGRLMATPGMANEVGCKACNKPVMSGNYCEDCTIRLNKGIKDLYHEEGRYKVETKLTGIKMKAKDKL